MNTTNLRKNTARTSGSAGIGAFGFPTGTARGESYRTMLASREAYRRAKFLRWQREQAKARLDSPCGEDQEGETRGHFESAGSFEDFRAVRDRSLEFKRLDLNKTVTDTIARLWRELARRQIKVVVVRDPGLGLLHFDRHTIAQVFGFFAAHACRSMPNGGTLTIRIGGRRVAVNGATPRGCETVAIVEISGAVTDDEMLVPACDVFDSANSRATKVGETLSVCRQIMEQHGGSIDLQRHDGGGVTTTIAFRSGSPS